jgi:hypothetical protein
MAKRFFRVQHKGYSFQETASFNSLDGGDGYDEGLAVSGSPDGLDGGNRFGGALGAMDDDDDVLILEGEVITKIYDGYRIRPTREIARFKVSEWIKMIQDGTAWDWE